VTLKASLTAVFVLCLVASAMMPAAADSYETVFSDWVTDGQIVHVNGCYATFNLTNGSTTVQATVSGPGAAEQVVNIPLGQAYYYPGLIRIYLVNVDQVNHKAFVDIASLSSSGDSSQPTGTKLTCNTPGQTALAGDVVTFPITINNYNDGDRTFTLSSSTDTGWSVGFTYGGKGIYKVYVPKSQSQVVNLEVHTSASTPVGEHKVTAKVDSTSIDVYVYITSVNQSVEVSTTVGSKIAAIGDKIYYDVHLKNLQSSENVYNLSVSGLPDSWYYRFKETAASTDEMAEVVVPASSEKSLVLEIVPPYNVAEGDYNFTATVGSGDGTKIDKGLTLKLKSGSGMTVTTSKLAYDAKPGQSFNIDIYVTNNGRGAALTNVYPDVKAPDGWTVVVSPNRTNSIKAGESQKFTLSIVPPGNIVASDYEVDANVKSDQAETDKVYRVTVSTESYIPYIGAGLILVVLVGLVLMYKKYGRR
jgi:uncharacterized membrane protein